MTDVLAIAALMAISLLFPGPLEAWGRRDQPTSFNLAMPQAFPPERRLEIAEELQTTLSLVGEAVDRLTSDSFIKTDRAKRQRKAEELRSLARELLVRYEELQTADALLFPDAYAAGIRSLEKLNAVYWPVAASLPDLRESENQVARRRVDPVLTMIHTVRLALHSGDARKVLPGIEDRFEQAQRDLRRLESARGSEWVRLRRRIFENTSQARVLYWSAFDSLDPKEAEPNILQPTPL